MAKLFGDYMLMTFHQTDRSSQISLVAPGQALYGLFGKFCLRCLKLAVAASLLIPKVALQVAALDTNCLASSPSAALSRLGLNYTSAFNCSAIWRHISILRDSGMHPKARCMTNCSRAL